MVGSTKKSILKQKQSQKRKGLRILGKCVFTVFSLIVGVCFIVDLYVKPFSKEEKWEEYTQIVFKENELDSEEIMLSEIEIMNSFGSRTTGSKGHQEFINWLKAQLGDMGLEVHSDIYRFDKWEEKNSYLRIDQEEIHVSFAYAYSGETDEKGVTGELIYVQSGEYDKAEGKIAVMEIDVLKDLPHSLIMNKVGEFPSNTNVVSGDGDLVLTSVLRNPDLVKAKEAGAKAVILIWKGVSEKVEDQYLPFTEDYIGIPAIWVNELDGIKVKEAAKKQEQGTVILEAEKTKQAKTESFYVSVEGINKEETILINTHTDGVNVAEENGAVGMLSMIRYLQNNKHERTIVFAFITGHFRLPEFKGTSQASSTWLNNHQELWDGENGNSKAVAGITVEHLGSMEWKDNKEGKYETTGNIK